MAIFKSKQKNFKGDLNQGVLSLASLQTCIKNMQKQPLEGFYEKRCS